MTTWGRLIGILGLIGLVLGSADATTGDPDNPYMADSSGPGATVFHHCGNGPANEIVCFVVELLPTVPTSGGGG